MRPGGKRICAIPRWYGIRYLTIKYLADDAADSVGNDRYWHLADIPKHSTDVRFRGVKQTSSVHCAMSAYDPKWTLADLAGMTVLE